MRIFALHLAGQRIRVNAVSPGPVKTDRAKLRAIRLEQQGLSPGEARAELTASIPTGSLVEPLEVAMLVVLACSPLMEGLTGAHLLVDGGWTLGLAPRQIS